MDGKAQVYIKIDEYRQLKDVIVQTKEKIAHARVLLDKLSELNRQEDDSLKGWAKDVDDVEQKVNDVDKALFEPKI